MIIENKEFSDSIVSVPLAEIQKKLANFFYAYDNLSFKVTSDPIANLSVSDTNYECLCLIRLADVT